MKGIGKIKCGNMEMQVFESSAMVEQPVICRQLDV